MIFFVCGVVLVFLFASLKHGGLAKAMVNVVVTSICYISVMLFIAVTFTRAFRKPSR